MMSLEEKKELIKENNVLIYPFIPQPIPKAEGEEDEDGVVEYSNKETIDNIVYHYFMQLTYLFAHYGFDITSEEYNKGINVAMNFTCATLYRTKNFDHDFNDQIDKLYDALREDAERGEVSVTFMNDGDDDDGPEAA